MRATEFDGFSGKVIPGRWAMIADCSLQMAVVEVCLRWGWVLEKYQGKEIKAREPAEDIDADSDDEWTKKKLNLPLADAGINDEFHWGWFVMFREVCGTILMAFQWLSGCSCHPHVNHKDVPNSLKGVWEKCPFRGRRAPELANGDFMKAITKDLNVRCASLLALLPSDLSVGQRQRIIADFESARAHIVFRLSLKLHHWQVPPHLVCALAHHDEAEALAHLGPIFRSEDNHPKIELLRQQPLKALSGP